jgi:hypothetical protein
MEEWPSRSATALMHARLKPVQRSGVPQGVDADILDACRFRGDLDYAEQVAGVDGAGELGGEHEPAVGPLVARAQPLGGLAAHWLVVEK